MSRGFLRTQFRVGDTSWSEEGIPMPPTNGRANAQSAAIVQKARMPSHPYNYPDAKVSTAEVAPSASEP